MFLIRTLCFRFLRYVNINANAFKSNPYAANLTIKRLRGMQSNAFEKFFSKESNNVLGTIQLSFWRHFR